MNNTSEEDWSKYLPTKLRQRKEKLVEIKPNHKKLQIPKDLLSYLFSFLDYKEMRNVRLVCHHWKYFVNEACLMKILEYSTLMNFTNDEQTFNQNYYKGVKDTLTNFGIDLSPSGLMVLCSYLYLPVISYTMYTTTPYGLMATVGWSGAKWIAGPTYSKFFAYTTPVLSVVTGSSSILSVLTSYFYWQFYYSLPETMKKMAKGWLYTLYNSGTIQKRLLNRGLNCLYSVKPIEDDESNEWMLIEKIDKTDKYADIKINSLEVFGLKKEKFDEEYFPVSEETIEQEEDYTKGIFFTPQKSWSDSIEMNYFVEDDEEF